MILDGRGGWNAPRLDLAVSFILATPAAPLQCRVVPELPEAETIARVLDRELSGRALESAGTLRRVWRYGKCVIFDFESARMVARLGMTGTFRLAGEPGPYTRETYRFGERVLFYDDIRRFGRIRWGDIPALGPDVLSLTPGAFSARLAGRAARIKPLLLDQQFVSGLGNIYVDEALFRSRIHPLRTARSIDGARLYEAAAQLLSEAVAAGGSTISDFVDPLGRPGRFQEHHRVYGKAGLPCPRCGTAIARLVVAGRGTHYCPKCQRAPAAARR